MQYLLTGVHAVPGKLGLQCSMGRYLVFKAEVLLLK